VIGDQVTSDQESAAVSDVDYMLAESLTPERGELQGVGRGELERQTHPHKPRAPGDDHAVIGNERR